MEQQLFSQHQHGKDLLWSQLTSLSVTTQPANLIAGELPTWTLLPNLETPSRRGHDDEDSSSAYQLAPNHDHDQPPQQPEKQRNVPRGGSALTARKRRAKSTLRPQVDAKRLASSRSRGDPVLESVASNEGASALEYALNQSFLGAGPSRWRRESSGSSDEPALSGMRTNTMNGDQHGPSSTSHWTGVGRLAGKAYIPLPTRLFEAKLSSAIFRLGVGTNIENEDSRQSQVGVPLEPTGNSWPQTTVIPESVSASTSARSEMPGGEWNELRQLGSKATSQYGNRSVNPVEEPPTYQANLNELELWTRAKVSPVVFGKLRYVKKPPPERVDEEVSANLKYLRKAVDERTVKDDLEMSKSNASSLANSPLSVAILEISRRKRAERIIQRIFGEQEEDEEDEDDGQLPKLPSNEVKNDLFLDWSRTTQTDLRATTSKEDISPDTGREKGSLASLSSNLFHPRYIRSAPSRNRLPASPPSAAVDPAPTHTPTEGASQSSRPVQPMSPIQPQSSPSFILHPTGLRQPATAPHPNLSHANDEPALVFSPQRSQASSPRPKPVSTASAHPQEENLSTNNVVTSTPMVVDLESNGAQPEVAQYALDAMDASHSSSRETSMDVIELISPMVIEAQSADTSPPAAPAAPSGPSTAKVPELADPSYPSFPASDIDNHGPFSMPPAEHADPTWEGYVEPKFSGRFDATQNDDDINIDENEFINDAPPPGMADEISVVQQGSPRTSPVLPVVEPPSPQSRRSSSPCILLQRSPVSPPTTKPPSAASMPAPGAPFGVLRTPLDGIYLPACSMDDLGGTTPVTNIFDPTYLKPRFRNYWPSAGDTDDHPYLKEARRLMAIIQVREDVQVWCDDTEEEESDEEDEEGWEEGDEIYELADDFEDKVEETTDELDAISRPPSSKPRTWNSSTKVTPSLSQKDGMAESSVSAPVSQLGVRNHPPENTESISTPAAQSRLNCGEETQSAAESMTRSSAPPVNGPRGRPLTSSKSFAQSPKEKEQSVEDEEDDDEVEMVNQDQLQKWTAALQTLIKGKKILQHQDLLNLKTILHDIHTNTAHIEATSSLAETVYTLANLDANDIPNKDVLGLRRLARKSVRIWGISKRWTT